jgi:hypothetical protein
LHRGFQVRRDPGFWAFSFGITALGLSCMRAATLAPGSLFASLALPLFIFVNVAIGALIVLTLGCCGKVACSVDLPDRRTPGDRYSAAATSGKWRRPPGALADIRIGQTALAV